MPRRSATEAAPPPSYSAPALEKGIDVIELLASEPSGLTIGEMATRLGRSISELFRVVVVLDRRNWLHKDPAGDRYRVTYRLLDVAHRATPAQELLDVAAPLMRALAAKVEQSCHLVVLNGTQGLVVLRQETPGQMGFAVRLGAAVDLASGCSGHVLLAFETPEKRAALLAALSADLALEQRLDRVREEGHESIPSARMAGVRDVSFPVRGVGGRVMAALTIPFLEAIDAAPHVGFAEAQEDLRDTARRISEGMGWHDRDEDEAVPAAPPRKRRSAKGRAEKE